MRSVYAYWSYLFIYIAFPNIVMTAKKLARFKASFFYDYFHTSSAIELTCFTLSHCCSSVSKFPSPVEANPHWGLRQI
jgi:hypothetical protein